MRHKLENAFNQEALFRQAQEVQKDCPARCSDLADFFRTIPDFRVTFGSDPTAVHPRFGLAWHPGGRGRLAIRAGAGIYSSPSPEVVIDQSRSAFPVYVPLNLVNFSVPSSQGSLLFNLANGQVRTLNPYLNVIAPNTLNPLLPGKDPVQVLAIDLYSLRGSMSPSFPALDLVLPSKVLRNPCV